mgnify:CR=1 FL=1
MRRLRGESGLTLVEILIAVTIMSVVTVTMAAYILSAMERSAEQNRRTIAVHLARYKAAELREAFKEPAEYDPLRAYVASAGTATFTAASAGPLAGLLNDTVINGTTYRYQVVLRPDADERLIAMTVRVFWAEAGAVSPAAVPRLSTYVDAMIAKG